jgi:ApbE superfamily uncharacterized protein (UPF0280 family)
VDGPWLNPSYEARVYRAGMGAGRFRSFELEIGETDLWLGFDARSSADIPASEFQKPIAQFVRTLRNEIIAYHGEHTGFFTSHVPLPAIDSEASAPVAPIVLSMLSASAAAGVGPMAAVAGAIAEAVGRFCKERWNLEEVVVENGGDLYVDVSQPLSVRVFAPASPFADTLAVNILPDICPAGVCTSSGTTGHSFSYGKADAMMIVCRNAALADAWATAWGNRIHEPADVAQVCERIRAVKDILGAVAIAGDRMGVCGSLEVTAI